MYKKYIYRSTHFLISILTTNGLYFQEAHPARLKAIHVIHCVNFMDRVMALVKPLMKSELMCLVSIFNTLSLSVLFLRVATNQRICSAAPAHRWGREPQRRTSRYSARRLWWSSSIHSENTW